MLTETERKIRQSGLGGSDIPALVGEGYKRTAIDVWLEKRGEVLGFEGNERTQMGSLLEELVADRWAASENMRIASVPTLRRKDRSWQILTPDRFAYFDDETMAGPKMDELELAEWLVLGAGGNWKGLRRPDRGVEVKTHGWFAGRDYGAEDTDEIPDRIRLQGDWYMAGTGLSEWHYAVLMDTHLLRTFVIQRDQDLEDYLLEFGESFWKKNVLGGKAPEPAGSESFSRYLRQRYKDHGAEIVEAGPEVAEAARAYIELGQRIKGLKEDRETAAQIVQQAIGEHAGVEGHGIQVTWKRARSGGIDWKGLCHELMLRAGYTNEERREMFEEFTRPGSRRMRAKEL